MVLFFLNDVSTFNMATSIRRWIWTLIVIVISLFIFNRWIVTHAFSDVLRARILRFQITCLIQVFDILMALFNWINLCDLFDSYNDKVKIDKTENEKDKKRSIFQFEIRWREIANWKQYSVKSALWRGFLISALMLSQLPYISFSFLISSDPYLVTYLFFLCLAFSIQLFAALVFFHALKSLFRLITRKSSKTTREPKFLRICIVLYGLFAVSVGFYNTFKTPDIKEVNIPIKGLPSHLDKLTITFVSDIHLGPTVGKGSMEKIVHMINYLNSDIVIIGGDLVDGKVDQLTSATESLDWIKSNYGVYFVTGNHEYYTSDVHNWFRRLESLGVKVLHNSNVVIKGTGETGVCLAGVDDPTADLFKFMDHTMDIDGALQTCDKTSPVILVAHQPKAAKAALQSNNKVDLVLSGHTHGGQMFPMTIGAYLLNPYYAGLYRYGEHSHVYVSTGTMYWGFPVRFGTSREINKITLLTKK